LTFTANGSRGIAIEQLMHPVVIAVLPKVPNFSFGARSVPEQGVIKVFPTNYCPNQSLKEGADSGVYGRALISSTSRVCTLACHR
jgi:hypothetical protein